MPNNLKILIVGSGYMASEYLKVLTDLSLDITVIGRGNKNISILKDKFNTVKFNDGGLQKYLEKNSLDEFTHAFNLVNVESLFEVSLLLLNNNVKRILVEKPGAVNIGQLEELNKKALNGSQQFSIAYNRRFYKSVSSLIEEVKKDGGITNLHFEFTEWVHTIDRDMYFKEVLSKWIISNSSHVMDTVFYLIGLPTKMQSFITGQNMIEWHKAGSVFVGSGLSKRGIPFSYNCNWNSAGRWSIEVTTKKRRFYLAPMEMLRVQNKGEIEIKNFDINNNENNQQTPYRYKDGIYDLILSFINDDKQKFVAIEEQIENIKVYNKIGGYTCDKDQ